MAILPVITAPHPILKQKSSLVEKVDDNLRKFMDDMLETMYSRSGVGLAAVQVGVLSRVVVIDVKYINDECDGNHHHHHHNHIINKSPIFLVNPKIIQHSKETSVYFEGCLSFPDIRADIARPKTVSVKYLDYNGKEQILEADELLATCIQHEIDHLNGISFISYLSKLKQGIILKKLSKT